MMGGNIKVKSELGKGSEITIGLRFKTTSATKNRGVIQELNGFGHWWQMIIWTAASAWKDVADDRVAA